MTVFAMGVGLFAVALFVHYAIWRIRRPRAQLIALVLILLAVFLAGLLLLASPLGASLRERVPRFYMGLALQLYAALGLAYLFLFDFVRRTSATSVLIAEIEKSGTAGVGREELLRSAAALSVARRLQQLQDDHLIVEQGGRLRLSRLGRMAQACMPVASKLLGSSRLPAPPQESK